LDWNRANYEDLDIPDPTTAGQSIFSTEFMRSDEDVGRYITSLEPFHRMFISLGHAARHMPCLQLMSIELFSHYTSTGLPELSFTFDAEAYYNPALEWVTDSTY
jgi:hypothetical protein